ncbi:hypothetical protein [Cyclobacterium plantarum]|uniref:hypothetical protein n=1 Tax=Cyclobacterium plantarum TaxID=2716263 RepID=UPI003F708BC9
MIQANDQLKNLAFPFREYYAYYKLAERLKDQLDDFFSKSPKAFLNELSKKPAFGSSEYICLKTEVVTDNSLTNLEQLLRGFLGIAGTTSARTITRSYEGLNWTYFDELFLQYQNVWGENADIGRRTKMGDFWRRARNCDYSLRTTIMEGHTAMDLIDLISAASGFRNFEDFLQKEFGTNYEQKEDYSLRDLYQKVPPTSQQPELSLTRKKTIKRKTFETRAQELTSRPHKPLYFIGREREQYDLEKALVESQKVIIQGERGMGKTALASDYYHRMLEKNRYAQVAWLFCGAGIYTSLARLAIQELENQGGISEKERIEVLVRKFEKEGAGMLLVLDNANDREELGRFLMQYHYLSIHVLVTTYCSDLPREWLHMNLQPLPPGKSRELFLRYYDKESGEGFDILLDKFLAAVLYNTLLIEVLSKQLEKVFRQGDGLSEFLLKLEENGFYIQRSHAIIESEYVFCHRNGDRHQATLTEIMDLMYDFSQLDNPMRKLLINLALLPAENHSLELLLDLFNPDDHSEFQAGLQYLFSAGWIGGDGRSRFGLHSVIKQVTIGKNKASLWKEGNDLILQLMKFLKYDRFKDNLQFRIFWIPYAVEVENCLPDIFDSFFYHFLDTLANTLQEIDGFSNLVLARKYSEKVLYLDLKSSNEDSPSVATRKANLAVILSSLGGKRNLKMAIKIFRLTLTSNLKYFGETSPEVAISRSNLALALRSLGGDLNLRESLQLMRISLDSDLKNFGKKSPIVALRRSNLAMVLEDLESNSNLEEAYLHLSLALFSDIKNFGDTSPTVTKTSLNLAGLLVKLDGKDNLKKALNFARTSLAKNLANYGDGAVSVVYSRLHLAMILKRLNGKDNHSEAENLLRVSLKSILANYGENAPLTAEARSNLAEVLENSDGKNSFLEALKLQRLALCSDCKNFGETSPIVSIRKETLAGLLRKMGGKNNLRRATKLLRQALASDIANFGVRAPKVATKLSNLAITLKDIGGDQNLNEALQLMQFALDSDLSNFGNNKPRVANMQSIKAIILMDIGGTSNLILACELLRQSLSSDQYNFGNNAPRVAIKQSNLAMVLKKIGGEYNLQKAKGLLELAINTYTLNYGLDHPGTKTIKENLEKVNKGLKNLSEGNNNPDQI